MLSFLTLPDGKHLIANDEILPFGEHPFENYREILERDAKGPSRGPANAPLQLVEFSDFQCPHCKEAQPTVERLLKDYPQAHFVSQVFPLRNIHSEAEKAAETGVCVAKIGGNDAFFKYTRCGVCKPGAIDPGGFRTGARVGGDGCRRGRGEGEGVRGGAFGEGGGGCDRFSWRRGWRESDADAVCEWPRAALAGIPYDQLKLIIDYDLKQGAGK